LKKIHHARYDKKDNKIGNQYLLQHQKPGGYHAVTVFFHGKGDDDPDEEKQHE
jgi:hypothetical protein